MRQLVIGRHTRRLGHVAPLFHGDLTVDGTVGDGTHDPRADSAVDSAIHTADHTADHTAIDTAVVVRPAGRAPGNQPLWPFKTLAEAQDWQSSYASGGHQPWHLDPGATALAFTQGYLGFSQIDKVVSTSVSGRDAHVGVGFATPSNPPGTATAAVLHLVRYGSGANAPWEVVGSADTTLTLTTPAYGALVASPVTVGGIITGVDEDIRVQVRQPSAAMPLGQSGHNPAGGTGTAWSTKVAFTGATEPVLTVVAFTGGHLQAVERFAVTAVHTR